MTFALFLKKALFCALQKGLCISSAGMPFKFKVFANI